MNPRLLLYWYKKDASPYIKAFKAEYERQYYSYLRKLKRLGYAVE